jgi:hypothetical protein
MARAAAPRDNTRRSPLGRALCVGVNAGMDARHFLSLATERGFVAPVLLMDAAATCDAVRARLVEMAAASEPGDLFLLTFSGHGGRKRVPSGEVGAWQLYDGTLNEEQLMADLGRFREGVRVLIVADNCGGGVPGSPQSPGGSERGRPLSRPATEGFLKASVLVLASCEPAKYADGEGFTAAMNRALTNFSGSYEAFHRTLCNEMPPYQKPDYYRLGAPNAAFESQHPFTI